MNSKRPFSKEPQMSTWRSNPDLMARLNAAQNSPAFADVDVTTFAGMCDSRADLERHVLACEQRAAA